MIIVKKVVSFIGNMAMMLFAALVFGFAAYTIGNMSENGLAIGQTDPDSVNFENIDETFIINGEVNTEDDDYRDDAEKLANDYGMKIVYGLDQMSSDCVGSSSENTVAMVCSKDARIIFVNNSGTHEQTYTNPVFIDYIKHEIAHKEIDRICGTFDPVLSNGNYEAVTSSYAVIYLGADYETLQKSAKVNDDYAMTSETDEVADKIFEENCG